MIELYTAATPNGWKVSVALEELDLPYIVTPIDLSGGNQRRPEFLEINPNGKIPAIVDHGREELCLFESSAILIYLSEIGGRLMPVETKQKYCVLQWLMFQTSAIGPMMGQANVFYRYMPEKVDVAIQRYQSEVRRLFEVLNSHLEMSEWLADELSIADIANWCWVRTYQWSGVSVDGLDALKRWMSALNERPAFKKGIEVPHPLPPLGGEDAASKKFISSARKILQK